MTNKADPRIKKVESIQKRIAVFAVSEIYTDELEAQRAATDALKALDDVKANLRAEGVRQ